MLFRSVVGCSYGYKEYLELQHKDISYPYHKFIFDAWCNYCGIVYKTDTQQVAYFKAYNFLKKLGFSKDKDRNKELIQVLEKIMAHINHIKNPNDNYCGLSLHNKSKEITEILSVELGLRITSFRFISKFFFNKYDFLESYYEQSIKLTELYEYLEKKENEYRFLCNLNNYLNIVQYKDGGLVKKVEKTIINKPCWSEINKNLPFNNLAKVVGEFSS